MQDDYAVQSFERGIAAKDCNAFEWEIVPVRCPSISLHGFFSSSKLRVLHLSKLAG